MKIITLMTLVSALSLTTVFAQEISKDDADTPILEGPYLGQKPPGLTPEVFAPGIVSTDEYVESLFTFSPDMHEFYFNRQGGEYSKPTLFVTKYENGQWKKAAVLSADMSTYRERFDPYWSQIKNIEPIENFPIMGISVSDKGTRYIYYMNYDGGGHISYSRNINGTFESPQKMNESINAGLYKAHPFIAPDESYLMWDAEKEGENTPDIYISFRQQDGSWGAAINMGDKINTAAYEQRPRVTPDGKFLFFWRGDKKVSAAGSTYWEGNPYWVDARIIETLRPKY